MTVGQRVMGQMPKRFYIDDPFNPPYNTAYMFQIAISPLTVTVYYHEIKRNEPEPLIGRSSTRFMA